MWTDGKKNRSLYIQLPIDAFLCIAMYHNHKCWLAWRTLPQKRGCSQGQLSLGNQPQKDKERSREKTKVPPKSRTERQTDGQGSKARKEIRIE